MEQKPVFRALVASDLDGTLLLPPNPKTLPPALFPLICRLRRKGVLFCAASGRSYGSLRRMFAPVQGEIAYLAENGALLYLGTRHLATVAMPRADCAALAAELAARTDCDTRVNTDRAVYYIAPDEAAANRMRALEYPEAHTARSFAEVAGNITQITAISYGPIEPIAAELLPRWQDRLGAAITGSHWLDFTAAGKGPGLRMLCGALSIPLARTAAFGDNFNDVSMLELAGRAYIMQGACAELLERFPHHCRNVVETLKALEAGL